MPHNTMFHPQKLSPKPENTSSLINEMTLQLKCHKELPSHQQLERRIQLTMVTEK